MSYLTAIVILFFSLLAGVPVMLEVGRRAGIRRLSKDPDGAKAGLSAIEGATFGLVSLLLAFTFSGAASRLEIRRQLIVEEANAISVAYMRIDLLPAAAQPPLREKFRQYLDARLAVYDKMPDIDSARVEMARARALQSEIWAQAVVGAKETGSQAIITLVLSSINQMIDITRTRTVALETHPPPVIYLMLALLSLVASLLAGYGMAGGRKRSWMHILAYMASLVLTLYVIVEIEFPRGGFFQIRSMDKVLVELRDTIK